MFVDNLNPIAFVFGPFVIRWYGVFLGLAVLIISIILIKLFKKNGFNEDTTLSLIIWLFLGGIIGARLGHILFYEASYYFHNPIEIPFINHGGLSSHGLAIGLLISFFLFAKIKNKDWKKMADLLSVPLPILIIFVRLGNYFNSEIVGRAANVPFAVLFPNYETYPIPRHPVQIYEILIGIALLILMVYLYKKYPQKKPLWLFSCFLIAYFSTRFLVEFTKEYEGLPPSFPFTIGQLLSIPFIIWAIILFKTNKNHLG